MISEYGIEYARTGRLSQTTHLNEAAAAQFMNASGIDRDVVIVDSNRMADDHRATPNSDTLVLSKIKIPAMSFRRSRPYYQITSSGVEYDIAVHDELIHQDIVDKGYLNQDEYQRIYLGKLNGAVRSGLSEILLQDRLNFADNITGYSAYTGVAIFQLWAAGDSLIHGQTYHIDTGIGALLIGTGLVRVCDLIRNIRQKKNGEETDIDPAFLRWGVLGTFAPLIPIDEWAMGQFLLQTKAKNLIAKNS